jgi:hypothetical protein
MKEVDDTPENQNLLLKVFNFDNYIDCQFRVVYHETWSNWGSENHIKEHIADLVKHHFAPMIKDYGQNIEETMESIKFAIERSFDKNSVAKYIEYESQQFHDDDEE